jgi:glycosyltransferase involved in cell wall biosynthesis
MPDVTVLMAVYNGEAYLAAAIDSVLAQTYGDFELLVVDDGSTDSSASICRRYTDARVRLLQLPSNGGLSEALNAGLAATRTEFVARLDADDIAEPQRLERQRAVMQSRPSLALLGAQAIAITPAGVETGTVRRSLEASSILWSSLFDNPFAHTTVMFRASVIRDELGGFRRRYDPFSQDYDLWCRVMEAHETANIPDRLVRHRVHPSSIMGQLGDDLGNGYQQRFHAIVRELIVRQARRVFGDTLDDARAQLLPGLVLGLHPRDLPEFLATFEVLLADFRARRRDTHTADFALTLARQFDALALHVTPPSRRSAIRVYAHALRHHPEIAASLSWSRALALSALGRSGRDRLGAWARHNVKDLVD